MNPLTLTCRWRLDGPLHAGTGLSRGGFADRLIRRDSGDNPYIPGDAVKGAIRMSAERLFRWLFPDYPIPEKEDKSTPVHPALRRIFQPSDAGPFYHFGPARQMSVTATEAFRFSSTAVDHDSRVARANTLRTMEASSRLDEFEFKIFGDGGDWQKPESLDAGDARLLYAAIVAADSIGGKRGAGYGRIRVDLIEAEGLELPDLTAASVIASIKAHLEREAAANA